MLWIAIAAAAQLSAPERKGYPSWFSPDDMPADVQIAGVDRLVGVRAVVGPDGRLRRCQVEIPSGNDELDLLTCKLVRKRAQYSAAIWSDGTAVFGVDRMPVSWAIGSPPLRSSMEGDLNLTVIELPKGVKSPAFVNVVIGTDETGRILSCDGNKSRFVTTEAKAAELIPIACEQLMRSYKAVPPRDDQGHPVRSVQNAVVRFDRQR